MEPAEGSHVPSNLARSRGWEVRESWRSTLHVRALSALAGLSAVRGDTRGIDGYVSQRANVC